MIKRFRIILATLFFLSQFTFIFSKTQVACFLPHIRAFWGADEYFKYYLNIDKGISPISDGSCHQDTFLKFYSATTRDELDSFSPKELNALASDDHNELNSKLERHGFDICLNPFGKGDFGVISFLNISVNWMYKGERLPKGSWFSGNYDSVKMDRDGFEVYRPKNWDKPVACVKSDKIGDSIFMTIADVVPCDEFSILKKVTRIQESLGRVRAHGYNGVVFPVVSLNHKKQIPWMLGMQLGAGYKVTQALQQIKFNMDEFGAKTESGVAMAATRGLPSYLTIDKPFFLWQVRNGVIIMAAYVDVDSWQG